jgi:hypothetical protein
MDEKKLVMAQEELKAKLTMIAQVRGETGALELAKLANLPYDAELPIPDVISKICKVARVEKGEDYEYFAIGVDTKTVITISNGGVTQANVTPDSTTDLTFYSYNGNAENVYIEKLMEAKYDPIAVKAKAIMEALNRKETKDVLDVAIASATAQSNLYTLDSGDTYLDFPKLEEMTKSLEKYGVKFALITGSSVSSDIRLLNYNADKTVEVKLADLGIVEWIAMPAFQYTHSTTMTVLDATKAILVALSDSADELPIHFVRRKIADIISGGQDKERIIVASGPRLAVGSTPKWAYEIAVMEQYGVVQPNPYATAVFTRS